jgi:hypothetical protein
LPAIERKRLEVGLADYREARERLLRAEADAWALPLSEVEAHSNKQRGAVKQAHAYLDQALAVLGASSRFVPRPVQEAELLLAYHPLPRGWAAFAQSSSGVSATRIEALAPHDAPSALAAQLLAPFAAQIREAESLRLIPYGVLKDVDFHALPFGDGLLIDAVPVAYGGDLGQEQNPPKSPAELSFLVVADPLNDLIAARAEGQWLRDALKGRLLTRVLVGEEATYDRVVAELQRADIFHFAGHAEFEQSGWQSGMRLAANTMLEPGDIVALSSVPSLVILSGCETTRERMDVAVASIGLAQAFLVRGAQNVIATTRSVPDDIGLALSRALTREDLARLDATSFRRVLQKVREADGSGRHWRSYRLLVP